MKTSKQMIYLLAALAISFLIIFLYLRIKEHFVQPSPPPVLITSTAKAKEENILLPKIPSLSKNAKDSSSLHHEKIKSSLSPEVLNNSHLYFLQELYETVLERQIHDNELSKWMNALSQGASREGVYNAINLGDEYFELQKKSPLAGKKAIEFARYFLKTYAGIQIDDNHYTQMTDLEIKQLCVKYALEVVDSYLSQKPNGQDDLYRWYAVLGADLAHNFKIFKIKIRGNTSKKVQYEWAKTVPNDILKSETIIRLHLAFNSLL